MALSKSSLLIRDYDNIRDILRRMYIYGCFTREDYIGMGYGGRKYDNEQRRINAYLPNKFMSKRRDGKKVIQYCKYNLDDKIGNYLAETYRNKSFTLLDVMSYFFVLQILAEGEEYTLPDLLEELPVGSEEVEFTKDNLRVKLDELLEAGLIQAKKEGRNVLYSISNDIWKDMSNEELQDVYIYLEFLRNTSPMDVPYYYLQKKLRLYLFSERDIEMEEIDIFKFRQNHLFNSLDNEVLLVCLQSIHLGLQLNFDKANNKSYEGVLPIKVIHDSTYGRQYLIYYNREYEAVNTVRIDQISNISLGSKMIEEELKLVSENKSYDENSWCTSYRSDGEQEIVVHFRFDEDSESFIKNRISREGHGGTLTKIEKNLFEYRNVVSDPNEMIPWIRSFGERAKVISSGSAFTEKIISEDWERAVSKYESIS